MSAIWTTKDGRKLPVSGMETRHIYNCLQMCARKSEQYCREAGTAAGYSGGEMAEMYAQQAIGEYADEAWKAERWMSIFKAELKKRGVL